MLYHYLKQPLYSLLHNYALHTMSAELRLMLRVE